MQQLTDERISAKQLKAAAPHLRNAVDRLMKAGVPPRRALRHVFKELYGERSREDRLTFYLLVAPIVRRFVLENVPPETIVHEETTAAETAAWLRWMEHHDAVVCAALDMVYFAGCTLRDAADVLDVNGETLLMRMRQARDIWLLKLQHADRAPGTASLGPNNQK